MGSGAKSQDLFNAWKEGKVTTEQVIKALVKLNSEGSGSLASFSQQAKDSTGGIETSMTNIKTAITNGLAEMIESIGSKNIAELLDDVKQGVKNIIPPIKEFFNFILDNGDTIIATLAGIAAGFLAFKVVTIIQSVTTAMQGMTVAQWLLNAAMNANPIGIIIAAIAGLVAAFVVLWNKSEEFRNFWIGIWEGIKDVCLTVWEAIKGFFSGIWESIKSIFSTVTETIGGFFERAWNFIVSIWQAVASWFNENVIEPIKTFFAPLLEWFTQLFTSIWNFIKSVFEVIVQLAQGCWNAITIIWGVVADWFNKTIIQPVKNFFTSMWNIISTAAQTTWNAIKNVWNVVSTWFRNTIINPISNFFTGMWNGLKTGASNAWNGIKSVFSTVANFFKDTFQSAWQKVKDVFSAGGRIFDGIKDGIVNAFKNVVNTIIRGINKVVAIPFNAINTALDKIRGISIAGMQPFSGLVARISVPQIPELERGGVLKKGQVGLLEGNGTEAVVPLEKNKYWIGKVADELKSQLFDLKDNIAGSSNSITNSNVNNFTQVINTPKPLSRLDIYRQTRNLLAYKGG